MNSKTKKPVRKYDSSATLLQAAGLRPTRQRVALADWLFDGHYKHVSAEAVHEAVTKMRASISLATVYNTLNHFTQAGLLRQVIVDGGQAYFDTNTSAHYHLFDEDAATLTDIPSDGIKLSGLPRLASGKKLKQVDIVLRVSSAG